LDVVAMEDVGIFYGLKVYFTAIWYVCVTLVYVWSFWNFSSFGMLYQEKSGNPDLDYL
jgi:uncharacterized membrane protein YphA (DoxX/SURF4 family)